LDHRSFLGTAIGLLALAAVPSSLAWSQETSQAFSLANPALRGNLAVYFVHGGGTGKAAPLTLDEAVANSAVKINETAWHPITIENLSNRSIFVPLGTLIAGGLQDQVVAQNILLPPGSGRLPLEVFCVDPFRSVTRGDEDPTVFTTDGTLFPARTARLALLASGAEPSKGLEALRQSGIWWSIDTARAQLSRSIGEPVETPREVTWTNDARRELRAAHLLKARESTWRTSLPLALESRKLAQALSSYLDADLDDSWAESTASDVIGAVFAVNGRVEGAEIYQSHELFGRLWPSLLRAYATQALAASDAATEVPPPASDVLASLAAVQAAPQRTADSVVRETDAMIFTETRDATGSWIGRSFVPKLTAAEGMNTPDATVVNILQNGELDGRALASLSDREILLARDTETGQWSAKVAGSIGDAEWRTVDDHGSAPSWGGIHLAFAGFIVLVLLRRQAFAIGRVLRRGAHAFATASAQVATLFGVAALAMAATVVGMFAAVRHASLSGAAALAHGCSVLTATIAWAVLLPLGMPRRALRPVLVRGQ